MYLYWEYYKVCNCCAAFQQRVSWCCIIKLRCLIKNLACLSFLDFCFRSVCCSYLVCFLFDLALSWWNSLIKQIMLQPRGPLMGMQNSLEVTLQCCELWIMTQTFGVNISKWVKGIGDFFHIRLQLILLLSLFWMQISKGNWTMYLFFSSRKLIEWWCYENPFIVVGEQK